ncbi:MAG: hypothetical protein M1817_003869 [Caeruleum heppii]|nr:MAG: hypothetical protein M1817_003869 [Caeruleum heppii]
MASQTSPEVPVNYEATLKSYEDLQRKYELSIIRLSEPITVEYSTDGTADRQRPSDVSADQDEIPTPTSLAADLTHYKELFSKLRFSYLEQVTKEKFLRAIVGEPPLIVEHHENVELEEQLLAVKQALKAQKLEMADMVTELERRGRELSDRHESIKLQATQLRSLPTAIENLQGSITTLRAAQANQDHQSLSLSLPATVSLVSSREAELAHLDHQIAMLSATIPRKARELDRRNAEVKPLEVKRLMSRAAADQARRRREGGMEGRGDGLEERGRWWRGVEGALKGMLEIEA